LALAVEGKEYANNEAWLEARRIANPTKKMKKNIIYKFYES